MKRERPGWLIDCWLGQGARLLERHETFVAVPQEAAAEAIQQVTLAEMPAVRLLFWLRGIRHSGQQTFRDFFSTPPFYILEDEPTREVVIGTAGRLLRPRAFSSPAELRDYAEAGTIKVIANFRVDAVEGGSLMSTETWVQTYGRRASWRFRAYWLVVGPFCALIRREFLRVARRRAEQAQP